MQPIILLALVVTGTQALVDLRSERYMALAGLDKRQLTICKSVPEPATCEKSCGTDYRTCVALPNCYNPSLGQKCCSDGNYCNADEYCTNASCCPNDVPLDQCGATVTLATLLPAESTIVVSSSAAPATTSSSTVVTSTSASTSTSTSVPTSYSTSTSTSMSTSSAAPVTTSSTSSSTSSSISAMPITTGYSASSAASNATSSMTFSLPVQETINAGRKEEVGVLGLLGLMAMAL